MLKKIFLKYIYHKKFAEHLHGTCSLVKS